MGKKPREKIKIPPGLAERVRREGEAFIPMSKLLQLASSGKLRRASVLQMPSLRQSVVEAHELAAFNWQRFLSSRQARLVGIGQVYDPGESVSIEERAADAGAKSALWVALAYYAAHGKLKQAYSEIRLVARRHWHPIVADTWPLQFEHNAGKLPIPPSLKKRIERGNRRLDRKLLNNIVLAAESTARRGKPH